MGAPTSLPHVRIAALVIVHQLISYLWYSPHLFAFHWLDASGFRLSRLPPAGTFEYYLPFGLAVLQSVLLCYTLAWLYRRLGVRHALQGLLWSLALGLCLVLAALAVHYRFAQRPVSLTLIDGGRDLLLFAVTGAVLGVKPRWKPSDE